MTDLQMSDVGFCFKCGHPNGEHDDSGVCSHPVAYGKCKCHRASNDIEARVLNAYNPRLYPITLVTVDLVVFATHNGSDRVLLIKRGNYPFKGSWALPGGFIDPHETAEQAALREVREEAGLDVQRAHFVGIADDPERDPRGRVVSMVYTARLPFLEKAYPGDDAVEAVWWDVDAATENMPLAFDHARLINAATTVDYDVQRYA